MDLTTYTKNAIGNHMLRNQSFTPPAAVYLALFTTATDDSGGGTEADGGLYARVAITLGAFASGVSTNSNELLFENLPGGTYTNAAVMDASTGGNMLMHDVLPAEAQDVDNGGSIVVPVGQLTITFQ